MTATVLCLLRINRYEMKEESNELQQDRAY